MPPTTTDTAALDTLRQIPDLTVKPIASSCCGMAGAFGYGADHARKDLDLVVESRSGRAVSI